MKIVEFNKDWQLPAKTELFVSEAMRTINIRAPAVLYVAFPWASLIDGLERNTELGERLALAYDGVKKELADCGEGVRITACQHIKFEKYAAYFEGLGITHVLASHTTKNRRDIGSINLIPLFLYPVQASPSASISRKMSDRASAAWTERRHLFSFVGAYHNKYYLTKTREQIFRHLSSHPDGCVVERTGWHFERQVYSNQVHGGYSSEDALQDEDSRAAHYIETLKNSKFSLCPSGTGPNSIRLWESIEYGSIPVVLADTLALPGDMKEWRDGCVFLEESETVISKIPETLGKLITDNDAIQKKLDALDKLREKYGILGQQAHLSAVVDGVIQSSFLHKKIILDSSRLNDEQRQQWLEFLNLLTLQEEFNFAFFDKSDTKEFQHLNDASAWDFSRDYVCLFGSKTLSRQVLSVFNTVHISPTAAPEIIHESLAVRYLVDSLEASRRSGGLGAR